MPVSTGTRPLGPAEARSALTMARSLALPTGMVSVDVAARVMVENRALLNDLNDHGTGRVSFTELIGFAVTRACGAVPEANRGHQVNLGVLVDVPREDGTRQIRVPSVKAADTLPFADFCAACRDLVGRAKAHRLSTSDVLGTTICLTNPGGIGTSFSVPRLMPGQRVVVGAGAVRLPAELVGMADAAVTDLAVSETVTLTACHDTTALDELAAGRFLRVVGELLSGQGMHSPEFYHDVFASSGAVVPPYRWGRDTALPDRARRVARLVGAYRRHRHTGPHGDLGFHRFGLSVWDLRRRFASDVLDEPAPLRDILRVLRRTYCG